MRMARRYGAVCGEGNANGDKCREERRGDKTRERPISTSTLSSLRRNTIIMSSFSKEDDNSRSSKMYVRIARNIGFYFNIFGEALYGCGLHNECMND